MSASPRAGWFRKETWKMLRLMLGPDRGHVEALYELLSTHNSLAKDSLFINLGYWENAVDYDGACRALAELLGRSANLRPQDRILDAGFGYADQDQLWVQRFNVARIDGVNVTPTQVELARKRVKEWGLEGRIVLHQASATALPFGDAQFDKVLALESSFHFRTREDFFREAFRVLLPGGTLALADMLPHGSAQMLGLFASWVDRVGRAFWQIPKENVYPVEIYTRKLEAAGFMDVRVHDISEHVFAPFKRYAQRRQSDPEITARANPLMRAAWRSTAKNAVPVSYVVVTAKKSVPPSR